jgi:hypothetical protein
MDEQQAREEIRLIKAMLERTKKATAESGTLFIFWGIWVIVAIAGMYILAYFEKYDLIWLNWIAFAVIGWAYSVIFGIRRGRVQKTRTYAQSATGYLVLACSVGFALVGYVFPALGVYSYSAIGILIALVTGILLFVMGGLFEWRLLVWMGVVLWLGAVGMIFVAPDYRSLCLVPLIIIGYLVPGFILRAKYAREQKTPDAE